MLPLRALSIFILTVCGTVSVNGGRDGNGIDSVEGPSHLQGVVILQSCSQRANGDRAENGQECHGTLSHVFALDVIENEQAVIREITARYGLELSVELLPPHGSGLPRIPLSCSSNGECSALLKEYAIRDGKTAVGDTIFHARVLARIDESMQMMRVASAELKSPKAGVWHISTAADATVVSELDMRVELALNYTTLDRADVSTEVRRRKTEQSAGTPAACRTRVAESEKTKMMMPGHIISSSNMQKRRDDVVHSSRLLVGIVVDGGQKYLEEAKLWLRSVRKSSLANATVLVLVMPSVPADIREEFLQQGAHIVREAQPLTATLPGSTPHSNKIRILEQPEVYSGEYDYVLYMDCDTLILGDPLPYLRSDRVQFRAGRTMWAYVARNDDSWQRLLELAGIVRSGKDGSDLAAMWPNTGVLGFPAGPPAEALYNTWVRYTEDVNRWLKGMQQNAYFAETVSFLFALLSMDLPHDVFPAQMNCQLNLPLLDFKRNGFLESLQQVAPVVLHYPLGTLPTSRESGMPLPFATDDELNFPFLRHVSTEICRL
eukprot:g2774.t1